MARRISIQPTSPHRAHGAWLVVDGARHNNLKNITVEFPLGRFVCVTGVSGSGKSSLVSDILREALAAQLNGVENANPGEHDRIRGAHHLDKLIDINQSPIGRTPRSNPATYIKLFDGIRDLFAQLPDSKVRGYAPGRFSFNVATGEAGGGRCEACDGNGANRVEMDFLADVWVQCPICQGRRFNRETLQVRYKGKSIYEVLEMDVQEALAHFDAIPRTREMLSSLHDVGLDYVKLGQSSTTLSGGEAQRIKLARELVKRSTGRTLYILDEPTTGLHFEDVRRLLGVLHGFVDAGNTVLVVEHNLDVIKTADWVIDLGPEGGEAGGYVVVSGTPEDVAACATSYTGLALRETPKRRNVETSKRRNVETPKRRAVESSEFSRDAQRRGEPLGNAAQGRDGILVVGAREHNLKDVTAHIPRGKMTVCSGLSGSGKTSFAIDTVYAEGQRRYVESLSAYARQFLGQLQKPKVDHVHGLSPAIAIEQQAPTKSPRSTVGTITEIYDYMRVLWARVGTPCCPRCRVKIGTQTSDEIVEKIMSRPDGTPLLLCAPVEPSAGETWEAILTRSAGEGYVRVRIDGEVRDLSEQIRLDAKRDHAVELVVDRVIVRGAARGRIAESIEHALALGKGVMLAVEAGQARGADEVRARDAQTPAVRPAAMRFSQHLACEVCGTSYEELTPHQLSFNSRLGWCGACEGLGTQRGTRAEAVIARPAESLLSGAIVGWEDADRRPLLSAMIVALAVAIGCDPHEPVSRLSAEARHALLWGLGDRWIDAGPQRGASGLRFQWKGFFPAIDEATRVSWQHRTRLAELVTEVPCQSCGGGRIKPESAAVRLGDKTIVEVCAMSLTGAAEFFGSLKLDRRQARIAGELLQEIKSRLRFLLDVGLGYLSLGRSAPTLSGGEAQRIRLASQVGSGLTGVLYVLDEPTIGLHSRDNARLIAALHKLRDLGNSLLLVEHDREVIEASNHLIDFGPQAGAAGGRVIAAGSPTRVQRDDRSATGRYLSGKSAIPVPTHRRPVPPILPVSGVRTVADDAHDPAPEHPLLTIVGARQNNLKSIDVSFPLGRMICVTGVSGSGKSSLITDILYPALASRIHRASLTPGLHDEIRGLHHVDKVINVDQQPIGNSPLSSAVTYCGIFDLVREVFARLPDSKIRGYTANRFSFNRPGGRCDACEGLGEVCHEMHFLPDVWVPCETCGGTRYQRETLDVRYKAKNIAEVLAMSVDQAFDHFANVPKVRRLLKTLADVGLGYLPLGQGAPTLSGGEAQRLKLAAELARPSTGKTVYILDEPTTGLHFDDLRKLLDVLHRLVDLGNTVICVEHNLDLVKSADWVIDLGPEAGDHGGHVVAEGTPEDVAVVADSHTGRMLKKVLAAGPRLPREVFDAKKAAATELDRSPGAGLVVSEERVKMPWERDGRRWHTVDRTSREGKPVEWEGRALEYVIGRIERLGRTALLPTDWNDRARVEVVARAPDGLAQSAVPWFCHALTGGRWLLDLSFRVPHDTFRASALEARLKLKPLDEREDVQAYGQTARVQIRRAREAMEQVRVLVHDKKEIATSAFDGFLKNAVTAYLGHVRKLSKDGSTAAPWKADGKAWHLSQQCIPATQSKLWKPVELARFIGRVSKIVPQLKIDWTGKVFVELLIADDRRIGKIITHQGEALRVDLNLPRGRFTPTQIEHLGLRQQFARPGSSGAELSFWFQSNDDVHGEQLKNVLQAAANAPRAGSEPR